MNPRDKNGLILKTGDTVRYKHSMADEEGGPTLIPVEAHVDFVDTWSGSRSVTVSYELHGIQYTVKTQSWACELVLRIPQPLKAKDVVPSNWEALKADIEETEWLRKEMASRAIPTVLFGTPTYFRDEH